MWAMGFQSAVCSGKQSQAGADLQEIKECQEDGNGSKKSTNMAQYTALRESLQLFKKLAGREWKNYIPLTKQPKSLGKQTNEKSFVAVKVSILKTYSATQNSQTAPFFSKPKTVLGQESKLLSSTLHDWWPIPPQVNCSSCYACTFPSPAPKLFPNAVLRCMKFLKYGIKSSPLQI